MPPGHDLIAVGSDIVAAAGVVHIGQLGTEAVASAAVMYISSRKEAPALCSRASSVTYSVAATRFSVPFFQNW